MAKNDHVEARDNMAVREISVFQHVTELGIVPAYTLFYTIFVKKKIKKIVLRFHSD